MFFIASSISVIFPIPVFIPGPIHPFFSLILILLLFPFPESRHLIPQVSCLPSQFLYLILPSAAAKTVTPAKKSGKDPSAIPC